MRSIFSAFVQFGFGFVFCLLESRTHMFQCVAEEFLVEGSATFLVGWCDSSMVPQVRSPNGNYLKLQRRLRLRVALAPRPRMPLLALEQLGADRNFLLGTSKCFTMIHSALILTLRDPPRPGPAHPHEHGDSAAPKSLDPKQKGWV